MIILYRYLMVCQVDYCLSRGEKNIQQVLQTLSFILPAISASLSLFYLDNMRGYLVCNGREETFRFNTDNFFSSGMDGGVIFLLPIYHPYRLLAIVFGLNENSRIWVF